MIVPYFETKLGKLYYGDAKEILPQLEKDSIDLVFTDPPYPKKYNHTFEILAQYSPDLMKRGASLITLLGHYQLEYVMNLFKGRLKYRWILHLSQFSHNHSRMAMGIEVTFKPMLWYVKGAYPQGRGFLRDGIQHSVEKNLHEWQQSTDWAEYYVSKLTKEGDLVLDPFMGSGTVAVVCEKLNRRWIGIEIEENTCKIIKDRLQ